MNDHTDIGRVLERWLDDGPTRMPDRVATVVADRIDRQPQRRPWRLPWRHSAMNPTFKTGAVVVAVLAIAILGWSLLPGGSTSTGGAPAPPSPSASQTPSGTPSVAPSASHPWAASGPCCQIGCGGPQAAGTYTSRSLKPSVRYTLTTDWVNVRDWPDFFMLYPDTSTNRVLAVAGDEPYVLILPRAEVSPTRGCVSLAADWVDVDAAGFAEYLAGLDHLTVSQPVTVTIGGLDGLQFDVQAEQGWSGCLPGQPLDETVAASDRYRFIILDRPAGGALFVRLRAPSLSAASAWEAFLAEAMPVVESFDFDLTP